MDRTERFYKIEMLLRSRGCVRFEDLRERLGVSPATLKRDLQYLRDRLDAPITYDASRRGYVLGAAGAADGAPSHQLPGVWFSEAELHALLTMHQLLSGLDADAEGVLSRHLQPLFDKLTGLLGLDAQQQQDATRRIKLVATARRRVPSVHFETVAAALLAQRRLTLRYRRRTRSAGRPVAQEVTPAAPDAAPPRSVSPQRLVHYRNTWYLDAWCHASEGLRRFALDAMEAAEVQPEAAQRVSLRELEAELDQGYGIFAGSNPQWAVLRFSPEAAQWVAHEEWHPAQTQTREASGHLCLRVPYVDPTELLMDLLRHAGQVAVCAPDALAEAYAERLRAAVAALPAAPG